MLSDEQSEQAINHLRAIRRSLEPAVDENVAAGVRLLSAQGFIDAAIALLIPAREVPSLDLTVEGPFGGQLEPVDRFDPYRRRQV